MSTRTRRLESLKNASATLAAAVSGGALASVLLIFIFKRGFQSLLSIFGSDNATPEIIAFPPPLGWGILVLYVLGLVLSVIGFRRPLVAGGSILLIGVCAFVFGGSIAQYFGASMAIFGFLLTVAGHWLGKADMDEHH